MAKYVIEGGHRLHGRVTPSGNKNAALPLMAATLLTDQPLILRNVPRIRDVETMLQLLLALGVDAAWTDEHDLRLHAREVRTAHLDPSLCRDIRASILLAGPMLARVGRVELPPSGRRRDWTQASGYPFYRHEFAGRRVLRGTDLLPEDLWLARRGHLLG